MYKEAYYEWMVMLKYRHTPDVALCSGVIRLGELFGHKLAY